jgi:hypothetical protein
MRKRCGAIDWRLLGEAWELQDIILATMLGCTKERVRQVRRLMGMPNAKLHRQPISVHTPDCVLKARRKHLDTASMTTRDLVKALGISPNAIYEHFRERKPLWDWSGIGSAAYRTMPDEAIADRVGCTPEHVAHRRVGLGIYRSRPWGKRRRRIRVLLGRRRPVQDEGKR